MAGNYVIQLSTDKKWFTDFAHYGHEILIIKINADIDTYLEFSEVGFPNNVKSDFRFRQLKCLAK